MPKDQTRPYVQARAGLPAASARQVAEPGLDRSIQTHIGQKLQSFYGSLVDEPVPGRFEELLARLEGHEAPRRRA